VFKVSCFTKLSRSRESLESVVRSNVIFESVEKVPSDFKENVPAPPVAVSTASEGRLTPTSCSRTLTTAFDAEDTVQVDAAALAVVAVVAVAAGAVVGVEAACEAAVVGAGLAVATTALPPHAPSSAAAKTRGAMRVVTAPPKFIGTSVPSSRIGRMREG
jgi:hypothetical protein